MFISFPQVCWFYQNNARMLASTISISLQLSLNKNHQKVRYITGKSCTFSSVWWAEPPNEINAS